MGEPSDGYTSRLYFRGESPTHNEFTFEFLQNFTCRIRYTAFYVVADNEDGDKYQSAVHPLNVTVAGSSVVTVDFEFPVFVGWEANMWFYVFIQSPGASGCPSIGTPPHGQANPIPNDFYSTLSR